MLKSEKIGSKPNEIIVENCVTERIAKVKAKNLITEQAIKQNRKLQITDSDSNTKVKMSEITLNIDALMANIPNFENKRDQDISFFIDQFQQLAKAAKMQEELQVILLKSKLAGNARQILMSSPELKNATKFDELKTQLIAHFKSEKSFLEAQNKFDKIRQMPTQSIEDFTRQFRLAAQQFLDHSGHSEKAGAKELLQSIKLTKYVEALRPDIAFEVKKIGPDSFEDAIQCAKKMEIAFQHTQKHEINTNSSQGKSMVQEALMELAKEQGAKIKELADELNSLKIQKPKIKEVEENEKMFCHICKKSNHQTDFCFFNQKNQNNTKNKQYVQPQFSLQRPSQNFEHNYIYEQNSYPFYYRQNMSSQRDFGNNPNFSFQPKFISDNVMQERQGYRNSQFPVRDNEMRGQEAFKSYGEFSRSQRYAEGGNNFGRQHNFPRNENYRGQFNGRRNYNKYNGDLN